MRASCYRSTNRQGPMLLFLVVLVVLLSTTGGALAGHYYPPNDDRAVQLNAIKTLVLRKGAMTTGRRAAAVPQLSCVGGGVCGSGYEPSVVKCTNIDIDHATGDPLWQCTAELANGLRLGTTDVICEGFRDRDDPWVLKGSCGLEYTLEGSPVDGKRQYGGDSSSTYKAYTANRPSYGKSNSWTSWANWIVGFFILYLFLKWINGPSEARPGLNAASAAGYGGGFGGGGRGGWFGGGGVGYPGTNYFRGAGYGGNDCAPAGGGGGGFWPGLGLGAGLGYLFGRRNNNGYAAPGWGQGWGGGGGYERPAPQVVNTGPATHTSTGYGGTRRRG